MESRWNPPGCSVLDAPGWTEDHLRTFESFFDRCFDRSRFRGRRNEAVEVWSLEVRGQRSGVEVGVAGLVGEALANLSDESSAASTVSGVYNCFFEINVG